MRSEVNVLQSNTLLSLLGEFVPAFMLFKSFDSLFKMVLLVQSHSPFQVELTAVFQIMILKIPVNVYFKLFFLMVQ